MLSEVMLNLKTNPLLLTTTRDDDADWTDNGHRRTMSIYNGFNNRAG